VEDHPVPTLSELLAHFPPEARSSTRITFTNPDVQYLWTKTGFDHRFVGRMLRIFGAPVVLEALRCSIEQGLSDENQFAGLCSRLRAG
jgi:hypothetical protein